MSREDMRRLHSSLVATTTAMEDMARGMRAAMRAISDLSVALAPFVGAPGGRVCSYPGCVRIVGSVKDDRCWPHRREVHPAGPRTAATDDGWPSDDTENAGGSSEPGGER